MTQFTRRAALGAGLMALAGCATSKFRTYDGPQVTRLLVSKGDRSLHMFHFNQVLASYPIQLGFAPTGHKMRQGDGRTPEGAYRIDRRNPNSAYHLSVGISYPNRRDLAIAQALGVDPGGDIFIHGTPREFSGQHDWTAGCIAVSNRDIEDIYAMVNDGTQVVLIP